MADAVHNKSESSKSLGSKFRRKLNVRQPGSVVALDFDGQVVRAVQAALRGTQPVVTRVAVATLAFGPGADVTDPGVIGAALAEALERLRLRTSQVVMGVPRHMVILRTLSLPQIADVRELASVVHLQMSKDLPFRQEEAVIDFKVLRAVVGELSAPAQYPPGSSAPAADGGAGQPGKMDVLVAAVRRETVEFYEKVAAAAKVKLIALGWLSEANARLIAACQTPQPAQAVALVSVRRNEVGIDIIAPQALLFSRGIAIQTDVEATPPDAAQEKVPSAGPSSESGPGNLVETVTIEVVRSLHSYGGMESRAQVAQVFVIGATGQEEAVLAALRARLSIPCTLLEPASALAIPEASRLEAADALGALGLGLGVNDPEGLPFDFLSPKRPAVQRNIGRIRMLAAAAAGAVLFIGLLGFRSHLINQRLKIQRTVQAELTKAEKFVPIYRKMQQQAATLQNWAKESHNWLEQYAYLSAVLPGSEDLYVTSLSVSGQGNIHLAVQARSGETLANLDRQLRAAGYEVKPLAITPGNEKHGYNFRSTVELIVPPKLKIDLSKAQVPPRPADDGSLDSKKSSDRKGGRS